MSITNTPETREAKAHIGFHLRARGLALASKFKPDALCDVGVRVALDSQWVELSPYPTTASRGVYDEGDVSIHRNGTTVTARTSASSFFGGRRWLWWDDLDMLYFAGYALWNYIALPFRFDDLPVVASSQWRESGQKWRRVVVEFPPDVLTHSRRQAFYFDDEGRLRRHDYTAAVFGRWARAAHYGWNHVDLGPVSIATRRKVVPRTRQDRSLLGPTLVGIEIDDLRLIAEP